MNFFVQFLSMVYRTDLLTMNCLTSADNVDPVDQVVKMSELLAQYGPLLVVLAVILIVFIAVIFVLLISHSKLMNQMLKTHGGKEHSVEETILIKLADAIFSKASKSNEDKEEEEEEVKDKELYDKVKTLISKTSSETVNSEPTISNPSDEEYQHDLVGAFIDVNMTLKDATREALHDLHCSRIGIYVFHNGNKSMLGLPFFKMSCVHEWNNTGLNSVRSRAHSDMPLHLFNDFIEDLWKYGFYKTQNIDISIQQYSSIREFVAYSDTKSLYFVAIRDHDDITSGFVVAEFNKVDTFESDVARDEFVRKILDRMAIKVQPIVGSKYVYHRHKP